MSNKGIEHLGAEYILPDTLQAESLQDRVILVTGAAAGLGRAAAQALAGAGATTVLLDKSLKGLESLYDAITAAGHPEPILHPINFEGVGAAEYLELATAIDREFKRLDGVLHNAAAMGELSPIHQYDPDIWARTLHVNINAPFLLNQVCLPLMQRSENARMVFTSDAVGRRGKSFWGAYGVSKAAIENMMEILAGELGPNSRVRVMSLDPGRADTALRRRAYPAEDPGTAPDPQTLGPVYVHLFGSGGHALHGRRVTRPEQGG
ncbi:NAD(P)-dependent dehydrogenase (short-subunit alcohol dehydrogenase family) [Natronocella acetinitrilica]|jgi:NAD(P)-dependent dehydrogenase (short-subunit alcohol dehydrogenase family)|uniref:NAD(P)-dependent dehydrogenase (Short-subunit alcohol dehydrogenase family) n=1 Tax=Natronocella acetinitrilica TaxID=414046 RepID=A0AAE3G4V1_9GAMM|nr:SDR family NAD(P)-dependent oxidoreductase [Natronocella acetinitrilica]MCP1674786.1 NAD(P)-dependent dehydrogenase (short-subunit alcohol dehydrogenase family) [Natronocella acetinitrilica]